MSFFAATACSGRAPPAGSDVVVGRMPVTSQCVNVPFGASGSSTSTAMLLVPFGTPDHESGGEISLPSHVYFWGMAPFSENAVDVTLSDIFVLRWVERLVVCRASASALVGS